MANDEEPLKLIRRIASVVGHELRNPLAVINNSAHFLKSKLGQDGRLDQKIEKHLNIVASEVERANALIEDILRFSRPLDVRKLPLKLGAVVAAAVKDLDVPPSIKIEDGVPAKGFAVLGDEQLLVEAIRLLLINAVDALAEGGKILISAKASEREIEIEVSDSGQGFKPEDLLVLPRPFYSTKPRGLGLGLAMVKKITEAHGGTISLRNRPAGGATIRLTVPI